MQKKKNEDAERILCAEKFTDHIEKALKGEKGFKINAKRLFVDQVVKQMLKN